LAQERFNVKAINVCAAGATPWHFDLCQAVAVDQRANNPHRRDLPNTEFVLDKLKPVIEIKATYC
jgi:hypothetical protein